MEFKTRNQAEPVILCWAFVEEHLTHSCMPDTTPTPLVPSSGLSFRFRLAGARIIALIWFSSMTGPQIEAN